MIVMPRHLTTARLRLRAPETRDASAIMRWASDARATRFMVWPRFTDDSDVHDFLDDVADGWANGDDFCYVLAEATTDTLQGMVSCQFSDDGAELGFIIAPDAWGQGLATEATAELVRHAAAIDDVYRVWAVCDPDNPAAARVLEHVGMQYEGCLRRRSARPNRADVHGPQDDHIYATVRA